MSRLARWILASALLLGAALGAAGQETYWCDSCDEVRTQHSPTCLERPRRPPKTPPREQPPTPAQRLLRLALAAKDSDEAIGLYQESLALDPSSAKAWRDLGTHLWRAKRWAEAERAYEEASARRPSPSLAKSLARLREARRAAELSRQRATLWREAELEFKAGDDRATLAALSQLPLQDARTLHFAARALARLDLLPEACLAYREALALEEDPARRARLHEELAATSDELERSRRRERRGHLEARAANHAASGELDSAFALLRSALTSEPRPRWIYEDLGRLALQARPLRDAARTEWALRRALRLDPERASTWTNLGVLYDRLGHDARALRCYRRAVSLDPGLSEIAARAETLGREVPAREAEPPARSWLPAPTLLLRPPLPRLDLAPLRLRAGESALGGQRTLVLRFDPAGEVAARGQPLGPEDPTLAWLRDHGSPTTWPELEAPLPKAPPPQLEGPRGWRFD